MRTISCNNMSKLCLLFSVREYLQMVNINKKDLQILQITPPPNVIW